MNQIEKMNMNNKSLKFLVFLIAAVGLFTLAQAKEYVVDPNHSTIGFSIRHLVTTVHGRFTDFKGTISYDEANPENSEVTFSVKTSSITTANEKRDMDLRSPNFFDVEKFPEASFVSRKVMKLANNKAKIIGDLTIHGVTKPVTFDVESLGETKSPFGDRRAGFSAETTLDRRDFGIVWNKALEEGGLLLGNDVKLTVDVEAVLECRTCAK